MLSRMFHRRVVPNNVYWAVLAGTPQARFARIRMHLEIDKSSGSDRIVVRPTPTDKSKVALSEFVVNGEAGDYASFASFYPLSSVRHQLRIMAAHALRIPIIGDGRFGGEAAFPQSLSGFWNPADKSLQMHLHHRKIQLPYRDRSGKHYCITAPLPEHMKTTFRRLAWPSDLDDPLIPS